MDGWRRLQYPLRFFKKSAGIKMHRVMTQKKIKSFFLKFSPGNLLILLYQLPKFEAIAVIVFEISSFLCPNFQRAITQKNNLIFTRLSTHYPLSADQV